MEVQKPKCKTIVLCYAILKVKKEYKSMDIIKVKNERQIENAYRTWKPLLNTTVNRGTFDEYTVTGINKTCNTLQVFTTKGEIRFEIH